MSRRKTERLLGLVVCLLATRRYLTAEQIRRAVPGYPDSDEAFKRMFERDKEELRELGIPLEVGSEDGGEAGYRIPPRDYELPDIHLTPDETAVLGLAARVWQRASLAEAASGALLKLRAAGIDTSGSESLGIEPRVDTEEPAFPALWEAVKGRYPVAFDYQGVGRTSASRRHLEPWGVLSRRGRWYVVGFDTDRRDTRVFRLSRIIGEVVPDGRPGSVTVPEGVDIRKIAFDRGEAPAAPRSATVRLRAGAAQGLRRWAGEVRPGDGEWDEAELTFGEAERFAPYLARFGADVVVLDPPDLREAVICHLKSVLAGHDGRPEEGHEQAQHLQ
ncbi:MULTISPECIES: helix-turn-helix transcriptional regulator [Thermomonospora]|uniref:DeoR family transcriptional regulator n=1 Tax=Thermomonospora curvata (strain ATCC 19995 / DSM 43183 / JCM 3096 / KCTC 9072 / NBRC 15933 / NCIMB 10081 / Henssen B9) TaxID=471852 RepID=D1A2T4_THECD|nr:MULTISPECIES: WYL domain-containing protein [Thermomonospora]ACY97882.1 DeoR family transcriptional regulator [Thermomonospora curvata DSM 43183]PKK14164.1 MAG: WYL domain-containing protein [Thermomonospora sp. CIF 1]